MKLFKTYSTAIFALVFFVSVSKSAGNGQQHEAESNQFHDASDGSVESENQQFHDASDEPNFPNDPERFGDDLIGNGEVIHKSKIMYSSSTDFLSEPTEKMGEVYKNYKKKYDTCKEHMDAVYGTSMYHPNELMAYSILMLKPNHEKLKTYTYAGTFYNSINALMDPNNTVDKDFFCNQKENIAKCKEEMAAQNEFDANDPKSIVDYAIEKIAVIDYSYVMDMPYVAEFLSMINVATKFERELSDIFDHCNMVCETKEQAVLCLKEIWESDIYKRSKAETLVKMVYKIDQDYLEKRPFLYGYVHYVTQFLMNSGEIKVNLPYSTKFCRIQAGIREIRRSVSINN